MSNYEFMRTGKDSSPELYPDISEDDLLSMINLFISNALLTSEKYSRLCQRTCITKEDIDYGIKYEVYVFFHRPNLINDIEAIKKEIKDNTPEPILFKIECKNNETNETTIIDTIFDSTELAETYISQNIDESQFTITFLEYTETDLKLQEITTDNEEPFLKISPEQIACLSDADKLFVDEIHKIQSLWDKWNPEHPVQTILKQIITNHDITKI